MGEAQDVWINSIDKGGNNTDLFAENTFCQKIYKRDRKGADNCSKDPCADIVIRYSRRNAKYVCP